MTARRARPAAHRRGRGFTLVELLTVTAVALLLATAAWPAWRGQVARAERLDALDSLLRVQVAQEQHRSTQGWYADAPQALGLAGDGGAFLSRQRHWRVTLLRTGAEAYEATATALAASRDARCAVLTLSVDRGFAREGPEALCWGR